MDRDTAITNIFINCNYLNTYFKRQKCLISMLIKETILKQTMAIRLIYNLKILRRSYEYIDKTLAAFSDMARSG